MDDRLGVAVLDRFPWAFLEFTQKMNATSSVTIADFYASLDPKFLSSHPDLVQSEGATPPEAARLLSFLGNSRSVERSVMPLVLDKGHHGPIDETLESRHHQHRTFAIDPLREGLLSPPSRPSSAATAFFELGSSEAFSGFTGLLLAASFLGWLVYALGRASFRQPGKSLRLATVQQHN